MSKRYGRNQRREHRQLIEELSRKLVEQSAASLFIPREGSLSLDEMPITSFSETLRGEVVAGMGSCQFSGEATVFISKELAAENQEVFEQLHTPGMAVQFRGRGYLITQITVLTEDPFEDVIRGKGLAHGWEVNLIALGDGS